MHVSDVHIIHSTTYYDPCYNPIFQAMKYYVATLHREVDCIWNVMAHAQKPDFVFRWNGQLHLNWRGLQFSRLLEAEVCASAVVMLDMPCSEVVWRILATHSIRQFPLYFPSRASRCAITFQKQSTTAQAVRCWRFTPEALLQSCDIRCRVFDGQSGIGTGFYPSSFDCPVSMSLHRCSILIYE